MSRPAKQVQGKVHAFNVSPKGAYEGLLVETEHGLKQLNFPQEAALRIFESAPVGSTVAAECDPLEHGGNSAHPVFHLTALTANGKPVFPSSNGHVDNSSNQFSGIARQLNYALHGEVNGAILDSGDFLHVKPQGAVALGLEVGMELKGKGSRKPMFDGCYVIEAEEVNGIRLERKKPKPKKKAAHVDR